MKRIKSMLFDNCDVDYDAYYEDYKVWCEDNEVEPKDKDSSDFWDYFSRQQDFEWEDFKYNCEYSKIATMPCVINGSIQLWNGRPTIEPYVCKDGLYEAICKIIGNYDCHIEVRQNCSTIEVRQWSHDDPTGNTRFTINFLNNKGYNAYYEGRDVDLSNRRYFKTLDKHIFGWM